MLVPAAIIDVPCGAHDRQRRIFATAIIVGVGSRIWRDDWYRFELEVDPVARSPVVDARDFPARVGIAVHDA